MLLQTLIRPEIYQVQWKITKVVTWLKHNEERFRKLGLFTQSSELELVTAFSCLRGDTKKTKLGPCCAQQENKTKSKP